MLETAFLGWKKRGSPQGRARFTGATERCPSWVPPMSQLPATRLTLAPSSSVCLSVCPQPQPESGPSGMAGRLAERYHQPDSRFLSNAAENEEPFGMGCINRRMKCNTELCLKINVPDLALLV